MVHRTGIILLRARERTARNEELAAELRGASGCDVRFLLDERTGHRDGGEDVVSLNPESYAALGLYTAPDAAWRCGDYGLYMAWREEPDRQYYWLIEDDVRIAGDAEVFFRLCAASSADLLCANLHEVRRGEFWWPHTQSRDALAMGCLFGIVRLSAEALAACFAKRRKHTEQGFRRALWPNDESLVTTTVVKAGLAAVDFNDLSSLVMWDERTYSVTGEPHTDYPKSGRPQLYHPVRFETRTASHLKQTGWEDTSSFGYRLKQRVSRTIAAQTSW